MAEASRAGDGSRRFLAGRDCRAAQTPWPEQAEGDRDGSCFTERPRRVGRGGGGGLGDGNHSRSGASGCHPKPLGCASSGARRLTSSGAGRII
jgi:hypothetical protein